VVVLVIIRAELGVLVTGFTVEANEAEDGTCLRALEK